MPARLAMTKFKQSFQATHAASCSTHPQGKKYKVSRLNKPVIYSADQIIASNQAKKCDEFVLCDWDNATTGIYLVEIKRNKPKGSDFIAQLTNSAEWMEDELQNNLTRSESFCFMPVLVAQKLGTAEHGKIKYVKFAMNGREGKFKHVKVGDDLPVILASR